MLDKIRACIIAKFYGTPKPLLKQGKQSENRRDPVKNNSNVIQNVNSQSLTFVNPNYRIERSTEKETKSRNATATNTVQVILFYAATSINDIMTRIIPLNEDCCIFAY